MPIVRETYPLVWPQGQDRIRVQDRKKMGVWRKNANQYRDDIEKELKRMGAPSFVISSNVQVNSRGMLTGGIEPLDNGVSVWFSRKEDLDYSWQEAFKLYDPAVTVDQIERAYRPLYARYHPDNKDTADVEMFLTVTRHKENALAYVNRSTNQNFNYVIACDSFVTVAMNMAAIAGHLQAVRKMERCSTSAMLERTWAGFKFLQEKNEPHKPASKK